MVTVSHCLSLTGGSEKSKIKTIIQFSLDTIPRHDEVKCLTVNININGVSGASLPEMILHCEIQTGPMSPDWGHMPLSSPVTKILMWHNINIRDVTHDIVILQIKAPAPSHLLDLSRVVTGRVVIPLYFYLWTKRGQWGDSGDERIFIWLDKYTRRLASWQIIIEQPRIDIL